MIEVSHYPNLNFTPALPLAVRAWGDLLAASYASNQIWIEANDEGLCATLSGEPVGVITFRHDPKGYIYLVMGWVDPKARSRGVYRALFRKLIEIAQARGLSKIYSETVTGNDRMRAVSTALGRRESYVGMAYDVPLREVDA